MIGITYCQHQPQFYQHIKEIDKEQGRNTFHVCITLHCVKTNIELKKRYKINK